MFLDPVPGISDPTVERFRSYVSSRGDMQERSLGVFDAFFAAASAGLFLLDAQLRITLVNAAFARISGKSVRDHGGREIGEVLPDLEAPIRNVLRSGTAIDKLPYELRGRSYVATLFPVFDDEEDITGVGGMIIDVTEHKHMEAELRGAVELRERLLAVVSHDLRNPLNAIELAASTMPPAALADADAARRIGIIQRAAKLMENLIGDLLDIATIQAGKLALRLEDQDAEQFVRDAIELHAPLAAQKHVMLIDDTRLAGIRVRCDRMRMLQVLGNLIGNSIKFGRAGDRISVRGYADGVDLVLSVSDTGPGIPVEDIPHLFDPYWTTARGRQRGTGLGLFITKAIVDAHGGAISVDSTLGVGTTFHVYLPLK